MDKKIAVWLAQQGVGMTIEEGLEVLDSLDHKECTKAMYDRYHDEACQWKAADNAADDGVSDEDVLTYLQEMISKAQANIDFWETHPRDINARFFARECRKYDCAFSA